MQTIEDIYNKYDLPSQTKLIQIAKKEGLKFTMKELDEFYNRDKTNQIFQDKQPRRTMGSIVAFHPFERIQIDLIDMSKFKYTNSHFCFIFLLIDVFTRKVWAYLMKKKDKENIMNVMTKYLDKYNKDEKIKNIVSDNEAGFTSKDFQRLMNEQNIEHQTVEKAHNSLGIVDRAIGTIKRKLYKYMHKNDTTKYIERLPHLIESYNESPHRGIKNLSPNEVPEHIDDIQILNHEKNLKNKPSKLKIGDFVRIRKLKDKFERGYEEKYSKELYKIISIDKRNYTLIDKKGNEKTVDLFRLKIVEDIEDDQEGSLIKTAHKEHKQGKILKSEQIKPENIKENKRKKVPKQFYGS